MCRHLGYLGRPVPLSALLFDPPHSLEHQSHAPADMRRGGTVNADGYGVGWAAEDGQVARYRRAGAIWADENLASLGRVVRSGAVLAAVRSATVGMPVVETACAPFSGDGWLFSHNGKVPEWSKSLADLASGLPVERLLTLDAPTDSALLWALVLDRLRSGAGAEEAVVSVLREVDAAAPGSRLNLLLLGHGVVIGTTWTHSLWFRRDEGGVLVASEPLDTGDGWREAPDRSVVVASESTVDVRAIGRR
ncbi:ergothioneine biosynthesis protein EgtC [Actinosynnema sp.]|uniref:ergothioneine biosynthesis protein EgtC n=1 Tax=Actinosynnema sp. TaxID=1872144 RepID=UPI003F864827